MAEAARSSSRGSSRGRSSDASDNEEAAVVVHRAELMRGHRPVVVSEVPVYVALKDKKGRTFEDKGKGSPHVRYRWLRGPVVKPCIFHPHKTSQFRDVTKTYQYFCSKECFLRGWHTLPKNMWGTVPERDPIEEPAFEWVEVATTRQYCPGTQDIDRPLRLDIIPLLKDGTDASVGGMSITTGTVIPTPKEARTRRMISQGGTFNAEWLNQQFKVMNWNVLADLYATESVYPYCEKWALSWSWRKHLILKELKSMAADIITLQEVQKDAFDDWFRPQLAEAGYEGVYQQKKREPIFHRGKYTAEGCATFYKSSRFRRQDKLVVDYDRLSQHELRWQQREAEANAVASGECNANPQDAHEKGLQRLSKGNIALAVILEDLQTKTTHSSQAVGASGGRAICVINTHILADPGFTDVKLWQAHLLVRTLEQFPNSNMPLLVCGDFNSTPDSAVYEYLHSGSVREDHDDLKADPCGLMKNLDMRHDLRLVTAYATCNGKEAEYTNYTEDFKGTLDYIWFTGDTLSVLAVSQVDDEQQLTQETALPSSTRPSDHVSLVATFMFKDSPVDRTRETRESSGRSAYVHHPGGHSTSTATAVANAQAQAAAAAAHAAAMAAGSDSGMYGMGGQGYVGYPTRGYGGPWS
eukprot:TRINITY_DN111037_c0_g1_i1.p1 TRINITY_DN111037_c0_g1~~TRINITY_DN111037_c0_g1_i1.p1  ORF type:complete len:639 (-),score=159.56 TRINITY_DN111037_c0_g1_i1:285-2201(-)